VYLCISEVEVSCCSSLMHEITLFFANSHCLFILRASNYFGLVIRYVESSRKVSKLFKKRWSAAVEWLTYISGQAGGDSAFSCVYQSLSIGFL
jgi:hypothetical protein